MCSGNSNYEDVLTLTDDKTGEKVTVVYDDARPEPSLDGEMMAEAIKTMNYKRWMRDIHAEVAAHGGPGKFRRAVKEHGDGWWIRASISKPVEKIAYLCKEDKMGAFQAKKTHTTVYDDQTNTHWEVGENDTVESIRQLINKSRTSLNDIEFK